jgi:hypothetical protein
MHSYDARFFIKPMVITCARENKQLQCSKKKMYKGGGTKPKACTFPGIRKRKLLSLCA